MKTISVVVPTFRRMALLHRCLQALRNQTLSPSLFEVLVVTDGPDPVTRDMVQRQFRRSNIRVYHTQSKAGPAAARNLGWRLAKGNLVAFTDDDTIPDKDWLASFLHAYDGQNEIAFTGRTIVPLPNEPTDYELNTSGLETAEFITANCCCTKAALEKVGGFDERFSMAWREDSDLHFNLIRNKIPVVRIQEAIIVHPVRKSTWGVSLQEQKKGIYNALLYKKHPDLYRQRIQHSPPWNYYGMLGAIIIMLTGFIAGMDMLTIIGLSCWLFLLIRFAVKRLTRTSKSPRHILEMLVTSACIPVISIYWQMYGGFKFRKLLW